MSNQPSTPVKVPPSAANHSAATLDPDLRSQINTLLLRDGHVAKIQEQLLHTLHSNSSNWPTTVQNHAINLLRTGEVTNFPALLRRVLDDVRHDTLLPSAKTNGTTEKKTNGASSSDSGLAIPTAVVDEALKSTRESLEAVCEIEE